MKNRKWSEWREQFNELQEKKSNFEEYARHLERAQEIVERFGNPTGRYYSYVNKLKEIMNKVNKWRTEVHNYFFNHPVLNCGELSVILKHYPSVYPPCKETAMIQSIIDKKERLEDQINDAYLYRIEFSVVIAT